MSKYMDVLLVEDPDGKPYVVTAPGCTAEVSNVVAFDGTMGTVVQRAYMDVESEEYIILSSVTPIHEADVVYFVRYEKEKKDAS